MRIALILLAVAVSAFASAEDLFDGAPPVPPGYSDHKEAQAAVLSGKVKAVNPQPPVPDTVTAYKDVEYSTPDGEPLKIDLYVPKQMKTPPPVLLFIHGGGWSAGKKEDYSLYNIRFAELGYATASVQYRLLPKHIFPKAIQDVNCAIAWLRAHDSEYGFDGGRMALLGGSAGGHLSLLAGYSQDPALACPDAPDGNKQRVQAIVNLYGVVDCTTPIAIAAHQVINFMGAPYADAKETYELASPIFHLDEDDPPTLTFHGTIDELVPIGQADALHAKLKELGIDNYLDRVEGWPHSMDVAQPINDRCRYVTEKFLEKYLPIEK